MNSAELKNTCCLMESNSMEQCDSHHTVRDLGGRDGRLSSCGSCVLSFLIVSVEQRLQSDLLIYSSLSSFLLFNVTKHLCLNSQRHEH